MDGKSKLRKKFVFTMEAPLGNALLLPDFKKIYFKSKEVVAFKTKELIINQFLIQVIWSKFFKIKLKNYQLVYC